MKILEPKDDFEMEDDASYMVSTGPPASQSVIDNLKRLLTQRQHSRESDAENKEVVPSTGSDLESDLSFYSLFTSTSSDSDLDDGLGLSNNNANTSPERRRNGKRRRKRNLSTSSTSSGSLSPVRERRRKPKRAKRGAKMIIVDDWASNKNMDGGQMGGNFVNIGIVVNPATDPENDLSSSNKETDDEAAAEDVNDPAMISAIRLLRANRERKQSRKQQQADKMESAGGENVVVDVNACEENKVETDIPVSQSKELVVPDEKRANQEEKRDDEKDE